MKLQNNTRKLALDAVLAAMCAVLGCLSLDFGNLKLTFESVPILIGALLFGAWDALAIAGVGTLISQILLYGIAITTPLWMLPCLVGGLIAGCGAARYSFRPDRKQTVGIVVAAELTVTVLNTAALYLDSMIYGYFSVPFVFGTLPLRLAICVVRALIYALVLPSLLRPLETVCGKRA